MEAQNSDMTGYIFPLNETVNVFIANKGAVSGRDPCCLCSVEAEDNGFGGSVA